jgi:hypothetical protein
MDHDLKLFPALIGRFYPPLPRKKLANRLLHMAASASAPCRMVIKPARVNPITQLRAFGTTRALAYGMVLHPCQAQLASRRYRGM